MRLENQLEKDRVPLLMKPQLHERCNYYKLSSYYHNIC